MRYMLLCLFAFFTLEEIVKAQNTNIGIQYIDHSTGIINNYNTSNINSDFGPRVCPDCSKWHKGIDLNRDGSLDHGDRIITPVTGTIAQIYKYNSYIVLVINGPGNQDYGYGHIFEDYSDDALPIVLGNFILAKMNAPHASYLAIIDLSNNRAFSTITNGTVNYGNYPTFTTTNTVQAGWPICPVGNSAAPNGTHLHLYLLKDPSNNPQNTNNAENPLQFITHQNTNFDVTIIETNNITEFGQTIFHSGEQQGSVGVEVKMNGAGNTSTYSNQIMDIEKVQLYIKEYGQTDNDYQLILGNNYAGEILLGGRINNNRYPSPGYPSGNTSFDIATAYGSTTRTGIDPFAYSSNPYDNWYFSDIYTRIHKDDNFTGTLKLASSNSEARYTDGVYLLKPKAYKIDNSEADLLVDPKQILIDNFRPYISNVKIKEYGATAYKYSRGWQWVNNSLLFEPLQNPEPKFNNNNDVEIEVTTSEPMQWVNITVNGYLLTQVCSGNLNKTKWTFVIPQTKLITGRNHIVMDGFDLANNQIQSNPASIPIRQSNTNWAPEPNPGTDQFHSFVFGNTTVDFTATQLGFPANTIRFEDNSACTSNCSYYWNFGDPANSWSINEDVDKTYSFTGVYNVKHSVNNVEVSKYVSVNELSKPKSKFVYSPLFTGGGGKSTEIEVDFFSTSEGIISSYYWDFGNGETSSEQNPQGIVFEINTTYIVRLTVENDSGSDTYLEEIYLDPATSPFISIFDWEINYFLHDIEIATSNFNLDFPITYEIEFGDGTNESYESDYYSYHTFPHQYYSMGNYLVVARVTGKDLTNNVITVSNAKEISIYPYDLNVEIFRGSANNPPYPQQEVLFTALIDPEGSFYGNWAIYKIGDPLFYFSQNFTSTSPELSHSFSEVGTYRVIIDVSTSGGPGGTGHAEIEFEVINAPKFLDVELYGRNTICQHTSYTYTARLWPKGEPGVPESEWWPTDLRWTLFNPDGVQVACDDCTEELQDYQSQGLQYHEFHFSESGIYKLRMEAWNDQHGYENYQLNPDYSNTLSFYDYEEMEITVSPGLPALSVITPNLPYVDNISSSGNNDVIVEFTNPGTSSITWEILSSNPDCVPAPQPNSGLNLHSGSIVNISLDVLPNLHPDSRGSVITINGKDMNGNHVQGSPVHISIYQNGSEGAWRDYIFGQTPGHAFGYSVSIDGLVMAIGSPASSGKGTVFIYNKNEFGDWVNLAMLEPSDNNPDFGKSIDIFGDYVIVSGQGHNNAYIFKKPYSGWSGTLTEMKVINNAFDNNTGINVTLWGDYAAIGAPFHDDKGIVQVYYRNEGGTDNWGHILELDGPDNDDQFGESVDLYNDVLAVGAPQGGWNHGYINVYERNLNAANSWGFLQKLQMGNAPILQNIKFGQRVSVFHDAITTSYFIDNGAYISPLLFPIYRKNNGTLFELLKEASFGLQYGPFFNIIGSISLFKDTEDPKPDMYNYKATYGSEFRLDNQGISGIGSFSQYFIGDNNYYFAWDYPLEEILPGDLYGKSVSRSYGYEIIGIPGYSRDGAHGAIVFQRLTDIKSNFEAGINFNFCNFNKPSGYYSTVNAANISLGGESLPTVIENGANIQYEAGEILLKDGFVADRGSNFTALSLQQTEGPGMKPGTNEPEPGIKEPPVSQVNNAKILKAFQRAYPDFPWILYHPVEDIAILLPDKELVFEMNNQNNLENNRANGVLPDQNPIQAYYILHLPGNDKKLSLPVKSNNSH